MAFVCFHLDVMFYSFRVNPNNKRNTVISVVIAKNCQLYCNQVINKTPAKNRDIFRLIKKNQAEARFEPKTY